MTARRQSSSEPSASERRRATTPEDRENQLIAAAVDRAEQQLRDGTASAQVITHFLKLATRREKLEMQRLEHEVALTAAKTKQVEGAEEIKALYTNAIAAMRRYSGQDPHEMDDYDENSAVEDYED